MSRLSDESTSPERQREIIEGWASANDHEVVGWAEDLDVSGAVDPFDTPALGPWLIDAKLHDWDILCSWKLDRIARRAVPLHRVFGLCQDHAKTLVCVSDNIDLSTWVGRLVASVIAGVAEGELEAIRERTLGSHRKLRELGRWPGGKPTYGYRAQERQDAAGWELVADEHSSSVVARIVDRVMAGDSFDSIARDLTARGEPSPSDHLRQRAGNAVRGHPWHRQTLVQLLRSKTLLGYVTHDGVTVRDGEGIPIHKGPALLAPERFEELQAALDARTWTKTKRTAKASPMLGVALCGVCESTLHFRCQTTKAKVYRYYYCPAGHKPQIPAELIEGVVEEQFLDDIGTDKVREKVFVPAESHQAELDEAVRAVDELTSLLGTITSATMRSRLLGQLSALDSRITNLEQLPARDSRWEYRESPQTYAEAWAAADTEGRRQLLLRSGITATAKLTGKTRGTLGVPVFELRVPEDIRERLSV